MDGVSRKIGVTYSITRGNFEKLSEDWEFILKIVGDFTIRVNDRVLYSEVDFCLVEFAIQIARWLRVPDERKSNFVYESMESNEAGLVWLTKANSGWLMGSVHQEYAEYRTFSLDEIRAAFNSYIENLKRELSERFGINVGRLIDQ